MKNWSTPTLQPPKDDMQLRALNVWSEMSLPCCMSDVRGVGRAHFAQCATHGNPLLIVRKVLLCLLYVLTGKELW